MGGADKKKDQLLKMHTTEKNRMNKCYIYMRLSKWATQYRNIQPFIYMNNVQRMIILNSEWILLGVS
jgi:hypothetical protein